MFLPSPVPKIYFYLSSSGNCRASSPSVMGKALLKSKVDIFHTIYYYYGFHSPNSSQFFPTFPEKALNWKYMSTYLGQDNWRVLVIFLTVSINHFYRVSKYIGETTENKSYKASIYKTEIHLLMKYFWSATIKPSILVRNSHLSFLQEYYVLVSSLIMSRHVISIQQYRKMGMTHATF